MVFEQNRRRFRLNSAGAFPDEKYSLTTLTKKSTLKLLRSLVDGGKELVGGNADDFVRTVYQYPAAFVRRPAVLVFCVFRVD